MPSAIEARSPAPAVRLPQSRKTGGRGRRGGAALARRKIQHGRPSRSPCVPRRDLRPHRSGRCRDHRRGAVRQPSGSRGASSGFEHFELATAGAEAARTISSTRAGAARMTSARGGSPRLPAGPCRSHGTARGALGLCASGRAKADEEACYSLLLDIYRTDGYPGICPTTCAGSSPPVRSRSVGRRGGRRGGRAPLSTTQPWIRHLKQPSEPQVSRPNGLLSSPGSSCHRLSTRIGRR